MNILWHNHTWKSDTDPLLSFADRIRIGDGVFDTLLVTRAQPVDLTNHYARLTASAQVLGLRPLLEEQTFAQTLQELIQKNNWQSGQYAINTLLTRGPGTRGLKRPKQENIQMILRGAAIPAQPQTPASLNLIIAKETRRNQHSPLSRIKSCNYGDNILAVLEAEKCGADDAILLNTDGHATCASSSNIFVITQSGESITPPLEAGVLDGTLRRKVMHAYNVTERNITEADLLKAHDIILTNAIMGMRRANSINGQKLFKSDFQIDPTLHLR